jgi:hypothetical protein
VRTPIRASKQTSGNFQFFAYIGCVF